MGKTKVKAVPGAAKFVLRYSNRKEDACFWDASSEDLEAGAFLALFKHLDEDWRVYECLTEEEELPKPPAGHVAGCKCQQCDYVEKRKATFEGEKAENEEQLVWYKAAKKGDALSAKKLLTARKSGEYEEWRIERVYSKVAKYPEAVWGNTKPCSFVYVHESGLVRQSMHGRSGFYRLMPTEKAALKYAVDRNGGDPNTKEVISWEKEVGQQIKVVKLPLVWDPAGTYGRARKPEETEADFAVSVCCAEPEDVKLALEIVAKGPFTPEKVTKFTRQICSRCQQERDRFNVPEED